MQVDNALPSRALTCRDGDSASPTEHNMICALRVQGDSLCISASFNQVTLFSFSPTSGVHNRGLEEDLGVSSILLLTKLLSRCGSVRMWLFSTFNFPLIVLFSARIITYCAFFYCKGGEAGEGRVGNKFVFNYHNALLDFYHSALLPEIIDFPPSTGSFFLNL